MEKAWEKELFDLCLKNDIEPLREENEFLLIVPKMPPQEVQDKLKALIPSEVPVKFVEGPRTATTLGLRAMFSQMVGLNAMVEMKDHLMTFKLNCPEGGEEAFTPDSPAIDVMKSILERDPYVENWKVIINGKVCYDTTLGKMLAMQVRPKRDICPTQDEILDLRIALENCKDVDEFVNSL